MHPLNLIRPGKSRKVFGSTVFSLCLVLVTAVSTWGADEDTRRAEDLSFFETKIRPVLENSCKSCHGPKVAESDLRLDSSAALKQGGAVYGPAVLAGKPDESPLFQAITYKDEDLQMPPKPGPLKPEVVADFRRWIERGAVWPVESGAAQTVKKFDLTERKANLPWLWSVPQKPDLPQVRAKDWPVNEIDKFLLNALENKGMKPADEASDLAWLRRATLILTGLPPTLAEVEAYQNDKSPLRREKRIDQLLASPAYGEQQARHWMDLVRYAESRGHEGDYTIANAWRYRDYLIQAFNDDVPYDQFVREHLAGDLLDQPRFDAKTGANLSVLGTGWPFLGEEVHSPVDIRQDETDRLDNKIDVLGKTFLGLTIACARCHDHKFDAISQKDYYALSGFFQGSTYRQAPFATMKSDQEIGRQLDQIRQNKATELAKIITESTPPRADSLTQSVSQVPDSALSQQLSKIKAEAALRPDHPMHLWAKLVNAKSDEDRKAIASKWLDDKAAQPEKPRVVQTILNFQEGHDGWSVDGRAFGNGPLAVGTIRQPTVSDSGTFQVQAESAAVVDRHFGNPRNDPRSEGEAGSLGGWLRGSGTGRTHKFTVKTGHVQYRIKGKLRIFACVASHYMLTGPLHGVLSREIEIKADKPGWIHQNLTEYVGQRVVIEVTPAPGQEGELFEIVETDSPASPVVTRTQDLSSKELARLITVNASATVVDQWLADQLAKTVRSFATRDAKTSDQSVWMSLLGANPQLVPGLAERIKPVLQSWYTEEQQTAAQIIAQSPTAPALVDLNPIDENVLLRGGWRRPGPLAPRGLPEAFGQDLSLSGSGSGRLELALSLTRPDQPLLARVWVNRLWQQVFGRGIVPTPDNFGILGQRPTHPELLDWLAVSLTTTDQWSTKAALRRMLLSRAFAMSSSATDQAAEAADPNNEMLHRFNLNRIGAEAIRDSILAVSGRLDRTLYGPGIAVHLTEFIVGRGRPGESGPLDGAGRRSIYTAVRRNFLPTFLVAFDFPSPFTTVGRRNMTNVPAQALALANDPFVMEQARFWADRELREMPSLSSSERLDRMFRTALTRPPVDQERATLEDALSAFRESRGTQPNSEAEAWADLAHLIFSLNEFRYLP